MISDGDRVQLKSGGPPMTAVVLPGGQVWCLWCCGTNDPQVSVFPAVCLKPYGAPSTGPVHIIDDTEDDDPADAWKR